MLFNNAGKKIKLVAQFLFWFVGVLGTILAIFLLAMFGGLFKAVAVRLLLYFAAVASVWVGAWIGSLLLYGFGELIDKTSTTAHNTYIIAQSTRNRTQE